jgi:hypothetical protein
MVRRVSIGRWALADAAWRWECLSTAFCLGKNA